MTEAENNNPNPPLYGVDGAWDNPEVVEKTEEKVPPSEQDLNVEEKDVVKEKKVVKEEDEEYDSDNIAAKSENTKERVTSASNIFDDVVPIAAEGAEAEFEETLLDSIYKAKIMILIAFLKIFNYVVRYSIWVLYARQLMGDSASHRHLVIGLVLYLGYIVSGLSEIILPWMSDNYGFVMVMMWSLALGSGFILLEGMATSMAWLSICYLFSSMWTPSFSLGLGYITKILPLRYSRMYSTILQAA
ncbi:hypothetical protein RFI_27883, partial [Reticulomyxa filosa]